jgi:ubiquinone/menaquinone biosynthesis C-methylase UbiE
MTSALFDAVAVHYDETFTNTEIGKLQRARVWNYLNSVLPNKPISILELNCGTGEDAIWFAKKGHTVLATDISEKMVEVTRAKVEGFSLSEKITVKQLDINEIDKVSTTHNFDLVFSNFGGLNCLKESELNSLSEKIKILLKPNGKFIAVVMPDFCMIESIYLLFKFRTQEIFRRKSVQQVKINDSVVETYYYHPKKFYEFFKSDFIINKIIAVGVFIPPSYLNIFFKRKSNTLKFLNKLEGSFGNHTIAASISDHFLIYLNLKK